MRVQIVVLAALACMVAGKTAPARLFARPSLSGSFGGSAAVKPPSTFGSALSSIGNLFPTKAPTAPPTAPLPPTTTTTEAQSILNTLVPTSGGSIVPSAQGFVQGLIDQYEASTNAAPAPPLPSQQSQQKPTPEQQSILNTLVPTSGGSVIPQAQEFVQNLLNQFQSSGSPPPPPPSQQGGQQKPTPEQQSILNTLVPTSGGSVIPQAQEFVQNLLGQLGGGAQVDAQVEAQVELPSVMAAKHFGKPQQPGSVRPPFVHWQRPTQAPEVTSEVPEETPEVPEETPEEDGVMTILPYPN